MKRIKSNQISRKIRPLFEFTPIRIIFGILITCLTFPLTLISPPIAASDYTLPVIENLTLSPTTIQLTTTQSIRYPVDRQPIINQGFHSRHLAIDLEGNYGDPVYPIIKGQVVSVTYDQHAYGHHLIIDHTHNLYSLYAHLSFISVQPGQIVDIQTMIGKVGTTGKSSGSHLHLEIIDQGKHINPLSILENTAINY